MVEALGAPLRLAYDGDGGVKFSKTGRPVFKVVRELSEQIRMVRENFAASLAHYAQGIAQAMPEEYKATVEEARRAGEPVIAHDRAMLMEALAQAQEEAPVQPQAPIEARELVTA